jgi:hypothetical protein
VRGERRSKDGQIKRDKGSAPSRSFIDDQNASNLCSIVNVHERSRVSDLCSEGTYKREKRKIKDLKLERLHHIAAIGL